MTNTNHHSGLLCVLCANHPQAPGLISPAVFVINGLSVCLEHALIAKQYDNFQHAYNRMFHEYVKSRKEAA